MADVTLLTLQGPREALAPGHGQDAPWPHGAMRALTSSWHWAHCWWARARYGRLRVARGCGERECIPARQDVRRRLASKISLDCIMHTPGCPGSEAFRAHNLARECWWLCEHVSSAFKRHVRLDESQSVTEVTASILEIRAHLRNRRAFLGLQV